jgi:hypothetical protein
MADWHVLRACLVISYLQTPSIIRDRQFTLDRVVITCIAAFYGYTALSINRTQVGNPKLQFELEDERQNYGSIGSPVSPNFPHVVERRIEKSSMANGITKETEFLQISEPRNRDWEQRNGIMVPSTHHVITATLSRSPGSPFTMQSSSNASLANSKTPPPSRDSGRGFRVRFGQATATITTSIAPQSRPHRSSKTNKGAQTYRMVAISVFVALLTVWVSFCTTVFNIS